MEWSGNVALAIAPESVECSEDGTVRLGFGDRGWLELGLSPEVALRLVDGDAALLVAVGDGGEDGR